MGIKRLDLEHCSKANLIGLLNEFSSLIKVASKIRLLSDEEIELDSAYTLYKCDMLSLLELRLAAIKYYGRLWK